MNLSILFLVFLSISIPSAFLGYHIRIIIENWDSDNDKDDPEK